jgi:indolepyruvate decarboxylase
VCVTYNVGGLKVLNPVAGAYAEKSPVLVIAGAPGWQERQKYLLLHHKVKEYDDQLNMFKQITVASTDLKDPDTAYREIDRVISEVIRQRRPGYIELPRDMVDVIPGTEFPGHGEEKGHNDRTNHYDITGRIVTAINTAEHPVIMAGGDIARYHLEPALRSLAEKTHIPIVTTILGKSAIDERNPYFLGIYAGIVGDDAIRRYVESSDCIILLGVMLTDVDMGANTAVLNPDTLISLSEELCSIGRQSYPVSGLKLLSDIMERELTVHESKDIPVPIRERMPAFYPTNSKVTTESLVLAVNSGIDEKTILITEVGDAVMMSLDITIKRDGGFMSPVYYSSLGFSVPAAIGVQAAHPDIRPLVLTGDGAFQMTGMEVSTAGRYQMNPIVIILNNSGFGTERPMIDGSFNDVAPWKYHQIPDMIGCGKGYLIRTDHELAYALKEAYASKELSILEVLLDQNDISPQLRRLCQKFSQGVKQK